MSIRSTTSLGPRGQPGSRRSVAVPRPSPTFRRPFEVSVSELERQVKEAAMKLNATRPIYRLHEWHFLAIFRFCLEGLDSKEYYMQLKRLSLASSVWNRLIKNTPTMWTYATPLMPPKALAKVLEKARNSLLEVRFETDRHNKHQEFQDIMERHIDRWGFCYAETDASCRIPKFWTLKPLNLRTFSIKVKLPEKMRTLQILGQITPSPKVDDILNFLCETPRLSELVLDNIKFSDMMNTRNAPPVSLPGLEKLHILSCTAQAANTIMHGIHTPALIDLRIAAKNWGHVENASILEAPADYISEAIERIASNVSELVLDINESSFKCYTIPHQDKPTYKFDIDLGNVFPWATMQKFAEIVHDIYAPDMTVDLKVAANLTGDKEKSICQSIKTFHQLKHLTLVTKGDIDPLIKFLRYAYPIKRGEKATWPAPHLTHLVIKENKWRLEELLRTLNFRYGLWAQRRVGKTDDKRTLPARLESAEIIPGKASRVWKTKKAEEARMRAVSELIGHENIKWLPVPLMSMKVFKAFMLNKK